MGYPLAFGNLHMGEYCAKRGFFWTACVKSKTDFFFCFKKMTDTHLVKNFSIIGAVNAKVFFTAAQAIPHGFDICRNFCSCPVGIATIRYYAAQMLKVFIFIFHRGFQPVFTVQIQYYAALVKAMLAFGKFGFHREGKELFRCRHLEHGGIVIAEVIIGFLP